MEAKKGRKANNQEEPTKTKRRRNKEETNRDSAHKTKGRKPKAQSTKKDTLPFPLETSVAASNPIDPWASPIDSNQYSQTKINKFY